LRQHSSGVPRRKERNSLAALHTQQPARIHGHDALAFHQHPRSVLQPFLTDGAYNLGDAHKRYTGRVLYIARWISATIQAFTQ
jgi:hypothetical protein